MCCLFVVAGLIGPRFGLVVWYLLDSKYVNAAFSNFLLPCLGFFAFPWTTLAYLAVYPDGIMGFEIVLLLLGFIIDLATIVNALLD